MSHKHSHDIYYVPDQSRWPILSAVGIFLLAIGAGNLLHDNPYALYFLVSGAVMTIFVLFGWFRDVVNENLAGVYNKQVDRSFRLGMLWFIFSEVMFFAAFFGVLFYIRVFTVPNLGGDDLFGSAFTHTLLWSDFEAVWPLLKAPDETVYSAINDVFGPWGIPGINTAILLTSGVTITWAHWGLMKQNRKQLCMGLFLTILLGVTFMFFQAYEYYHAYEQLGLTLGSGIYGSTFFLLTGFHGMHVTIGAIILLVIFFRSVVGHFTPKNHFAFEAAAWYWHFVDVVWLILFVFVYWL